MNWLFRESPHCVHDSLVCAEYGDEQDRDGRQNGEEVSQECSGISVQALKHQENGWGDDQQQYDGKQNQHDRDLKIQDGASVLVDFVALVLFPRPQKQGDEDDAYHTAHMQ